MTESEWLSCANPTPMLQILHGKVSERKLRLFACACVRRIGHLLKDERTRNAVATAEAAAEGLVSGRDLNGLWLTLSDFEVTDYAKLAGRSTILPGAAAAARTAADNARLAAGAKAYELAYHRRDTSVTLCEQERLAAWSHERQAQAALLRELVGNPFQPKRLAEEWLAWNSGTPLKLAQVIAAEQSFEQLPILADALEDAGCTDADILGHLRGPATHIRGCWALDLIGARG